MRVTCLWHLYGMCVKTCFNISVTHGAESSE